MALLFDGKTGRRPSAEARRYVYRMIDAMLEHELTDPDGWVFGGVEEEADLRRVKRAVAGVREEMQKRGGKRAELPR